MHTVESEINLCNLFDEFNLFQVNNKPSRSGCKNILDVILVNKPQQVSNVVTLVSLVDTDQFQLDFDYNFGPNGKNDNGYKQNKKKVYMFQNTNFDELSYYLCKANLDHVVSENLANVDIAWQQWKA